MRPLEIVCVSRNAPPMNDAEALCTGRLLSALVQLGANVHLVTGDGHPALDPSIVDEIFDPRIEATTVSAPSDRLHKASSMIRHGYHGTQVEWMKPAILATQQVLAMLTKPVLMTRACPWVSNFVGYHCRHLATAWVAHFSDPFPPHEWRNHWYSRFVRPLNRMWARRILKQADLVTVTCPNAIRYIEDKSGVPFRDKAMVVTHLAMPQLRPGNSKLQRKPGEGARRISSRGRKFFKPLDFLVAWYMQRHILPPCKPTKSPNASLKWPPSPAWSVAASR